MKDIVIKGEFIKRELKVLLGTYVAANLVNAFAIWRYDTNWIELIRFQLMVLFITAILYGLTWLVRAVVLVVTSLLPRLKR